MSSNLTTFTSESVMITLEELNTKWCFQFDNYSPTEILEKFRSNLLLSSTDTNESINSSIEIEFNNIFMLQETLEKNNLVGNNSEEQIENKCKLNKILAVVHYAKNTMIGLAMVSTTLKPEHSYSPSEDQSIYKFHPLDNDDLKPIQKICMYLSSKFYELKYKRCEEYCYECILSKDGFPTYAWKKVDSISNIIYKLLSRSNNLNMFLLSIKTKDVVKQFTEYFSKCYDDLFPKLVKDRHVFSFKNGLYLVKYWDEENEIYTDKFYEYGDPNIPTHFTSCKYFDVPLTNTTNSIQPEDIHIPLLDQIFEYQNLDKDVIEWNKVYLGRLLYPLNDLDNWQTIMFYLGQGGTGKSTINNDVAKQFYDDGDVAVLSNNVQSKFGLSDIYSKYIFIAPEIKKDWCLEQAEFQSMISGETINVNIKYKKSEVVKWETAGILGGNENPDFIDNSGSIKRRIVVTRFDNKVKKNDCMLGKKLRVCIPDIIRQCNLYYQRMTRNVGYDNIWDHLPSYFLNTQEKMVDATNSLSNFFNSGKIVIDSNRFIPMQLFVRKFNEHCSENNFKKNKFVVDFYQSTFAQHNIVVKTNVTKFYKGNKLKGTYFIGVDLQYEEENSESEQEECNL